MHQAMLLSEVITKAQMRLGRPLPEDWLTRYERDRTEAFRRKLKPPCPTQPRPSSASAPPG